MMQLLNGSTHQGFTFQISVAKNRIEGQKLTDDRHLENGPIRTPIKSGPCTLPLRCSQENQSSVASQGGTAFEVQTFEPQYSHNPVPRSHDSHVTKEQESDSQVQNRFRGLINDLDPGDNQSDSDDSSITDFLEWEHVLDSVPSLSQVISSQGTSEHANANRNTTREFLKKSCDQSHDRSRFQPEAVLNGGVNSPESQIISRSESCDQSWDVAPLALSGPSPPNEFGLIPVQVSEVKLKFDYCAR